MVVEAVIGKSVCPQPISSEVVIDVVHGMLNALGWGDHDALE